MLGLILSAYTCSDILNSSFSKQWKARDANAVTARKSPILEACRGIIHRGIATCIGALKDGFLGDFRCPSQVPIAGAHRIA